MTNLADRNDYLSAGVHIGMKEKSKHMDKFIFKKRDDGITVLDIEKTDEKIKSAGNFLSGFNPDKIIVVSRRISGHNPVDNFSKAIGCKNVTGRFFPGALTNPSFKNYFEAEVLIVIDPAIDKQAVKEAVQKKIPIIGICNTNSNLEYMDLIIPANNKGNKSIGLILYLLAKEILKSRKSQADLDVKDFVQD